MSYEEAIEILEDNNNYLHDKDYLRYSNGFDAIETIKQYLDEYRWHDLIKNPDDLPDEDYDVELITLEPYYYRKLYGCYDNGWEDNYGNLISCKIKAWKRYEGYPHIDEKEKLENEA